MPRGHGYVLAMGRAYVVCPKRSGIQLLRMSSCTAFSLATRVLSTGVNSDLARTAIEVPTKCGMLLDI